MTRFRYTDEMIDWVRANAPGIRRRELTKKFNSKFRVNKAYSSICSMMKNHHITCDMPSGGKDIAQRKYSDEMLNFLKEKYLVHSQPELMTLFIEKFSIKITPKAFSSLLKRYKIRSGRTGRFETGNEPFNKGVKGWDSGGGSHKTRFKKGQKPSNTKYLGHERLDKDGYILIQVNEVNPHTGYKNRYVFKHRYVWEKAHGKIPLGMCIKFVDGNKSNCDLDNLMLIDRATNIALMRRNYDFAPAEIKPTILATAQLQVGAKRKQQEVK